MRPVVDVSGTAVIVREGGQMQRIPCGTVDAAWEHAAELEAEHEAAEAAHADLINSYLERGVDVTLPHPDDPIAALIKHPVDDAVALSPDAPTPGGPGSAAAANRVTPPTPVDPGLVHNPAVTLVSDNNIVGEVSTVTYDATPAVEEPDPTAVLPQVGVSARYEPDSERVVVTFTIDEPVQLWRSVGGRTADVTLDPDGQLVRAFKAAPSDVLEIRRSPEGEVIYSGLAGPQADESDGGEEENEHED